MISQQIVKSVAFMVIDALTERSPSIDIRYGGMTPATGGYNGIATIFLKDKRYCLRFDITVAYSEIEVVYPAEVSNSSVALSYLRSRDGHNLHVVCVMCFGLWFDRWSIPHFWAFWVNGYHLEDPKFPEAIADNAIGQHKLAKPYWKAILLSYERERKQRLMEY